MLFTKESLSPRKSLRKCLFLLAGFLCVLFSIHLVSPDHVSAAPLQGGADFVTDDRPNAENVVHNVSFVLPKTGPGIGLSDYLIINFPNYSDVTVPSSSSGWSSGSPVYNLSGNRVLITNVTAPQGGAIGISGITATNPATGLATEISVQIGDDTIPTTLFYDTVITPTTYKGTTTASVVVTTQIATLEFQGFSSPNSFITILINGEVAGTTVASSSGNFLKSISGLEPNYTYNVGIFATDSNGRTTRTVSFTAMTLSGVYVVVRDIVIPTTIEVDPDLIYQGDNTTIKGLSHPYSQITLDIEGSNSYTNVLTANSAGIWSYVLNTINYPLLPATHQVYAREVVQGGYTSIPTQEEELIVKKCRIADLDCDNHVNLTDFSIMMFFWSKKNPANHRADVNKDSWVNLTDFSLLLYHWTG